MLISNLELQLMYAEDLLFTLSTSLIPRPPFRGLGMRLLSFKSLGMRLPPLQGSVYETTPLQGSGYETTLLQESGYETTPFRGLGMRLPPLQGSGYETTPLQGSGYETTPLQGSGYETCSLPHTHVPVPLSNDHVALVGLQLLSGFTSIFIIMPNGSDYGQGG